MLEQDIVLQDRYRIVRVLDGGGMEQIYLAHDTRLADKPCAVKEMTPTRTPHPMNRNKPPTSSTARPPSWPT